MKNIRSFFVAVLFGLVLFTVPRAGWAVLANAWHIPDNTGDVGVHMRNPQFEFGPSSSVTNYSGLQKLNNGFGTANQTGGWVVFKGATQSTWSSNAFGFQADSGQNQYWKGVFNTSAFGTNEVIQYYLYLTFDGVNGVQNTYIYGGGDAGGSQNTATEATARATPFTVRNRPAWLYHGNNRVINPGADASHFNVDVAVKAGYIGKDDSTASRYADNGRVYFTTDGSTPAGALGVGSGTTQVAPLAFDHRENDPSAAGNAMWWKGTLTNLAQFATVKYKIGLWHSANNEEKFADYNATTNNAFTFTLGTIGDPALSINGLNADYTTTHCFVDEVAGDSFPLNILFAPGVASLTQVEVFSNVNRRDRAALDINGDGIEDGIVGPNGNGIVANDGTNYYQAYTMTATATPGQYSYTLPATKTGAYRLTARYKVSGNTNWFWYSSNGRRDHAVVVSPKKSRDIVLYELNTLNVESQGQDLASRSTFTDLYDGPNSRAYNATNSKFNLDYIANLGVNWLWFQPIHPAGVAGREIDPATGQGYEVGSPYAVKNFFEVNPMMGKDNTRAGAMQEFTNFVAAADNRGVSVMLDAAFNHTAYDCELAASGVFYWGGAGNPGNWQATDEIRNREARVYSRTDAYDMRATGTGDIAPAPDRYDFGKWGDTKDIYFGRYAALVANSGASSSYLNEGDWMDTSIGSESSAGDTNGHFDAVTRNVWRYYADYILYWLDKTGCASGTPANQTSKGIDGLRADFGQGLPPQCWEYIINKTRSRKWDFVFMSESLDGGAVTYRSNRHFDMLNENIVFSLKSAANATDYRNIFESRRAAYGQGLVLLNITSHDEETYDDPFQMLVRYTVNGTIDGAPMIFYGQELGVSRLFGFDRYELNFGKEVPHFKKFNSLQPILYPGNRTNGQDYLYPVYAAVNQARQFSRALKSSNRWFIDQTSGSSQPNIFSVAKYETANASPNQADVVFGFADLDRYNDQSGTFNVNITQNGSNLFGIKPGRTYNVKNIAAYTGFDANRRNAWLWGGGTAGSNVLANGITVILKKVPTSDAGWTSAPFEAQYLKLYDVTPPPTPGTPTMAKPYALGTVATIAWPAVSDPDGGISGYHLVVGTTPGGSNVFNGTISGTSAPATNVIGQTLYAKVSAINNAGIEGGASANSAGVILLDPNVDSDGDGMSNAAEDLAGTNPLDSASALRILSFTGGSTLTWSSVTGRTYKVLAASALGAGFTPASGVITGASATASWLDPNATNAAKFYRVQLQP
ncbi:MAG: alpha-amylase family glycosyl hydrolase [Verrucomicrobia bacterium]|nr:alpha-amylase family glycosyl hydrolase [Verrucomicrobiota bacterium]